MVLANDGLVGEDEMQILDRIRPGVRHLSMASEAADGVIRVQPLIRMSGGQPRLCQLGLIESIRQAATPLLRTFGASAAKRPKLNRRVVWESARAVALPYRRQRRSRRLPLAVRVYRGLG